MTQLSVPDFLDMVERSGLVDKAHLSQTFSALETGPTSAASDTRQVCSRLAKAGLLTDWQGQQLLEGRCRDFFIGKYKLLDHLGTGGMGSVYLAEHVVMRRQVAIKLLAAGRVHDSSYLGRFHREARAVATLDHRNIVRAFDVDNDGDTHYLVMEYVAGRDLNSIVVRDGPLDFAVAANDIRQAADGLAHAHRAGLVHRDIKPANLLVDAAGTVKILDLGLARFDQDDEASLTRQFDERVLGTVDYLAPEQAFDSHLVDARADVYSLGCTLYFALTGHPPFPTGTLAQRVLWHQTRQPKPLELERPGTPPQLAAICRRMMAKSPSERYQTANDVSAALAAWLEVVRRPAVEPGATIAPVDEQPLSLVPLDDEPSRQAPVPTGPACNPRPLSAIVVSCASESTQPTPRVDRRPQADSQTVPSGLQEVSTRNDWLNDLLPVEAVTIPEASRLGSARAWSGSRRGKRWESPWFLIGVGTVLGAVFAAVWLIVRALLG